MLSRVFGVIGYREILVFMKFLFWMVGRYVEDGVRLRL